MREVGDRESVEGEHIDFLGWQGGELCGGNGFCSACEVGVFKYSGMLREGSVDREAVGELID